MTTRYAAPPHPHLRLMVTDDLAEVAALDRAACPDPWTRADIACHLRRSPFCRGVVAERVVVDEHGGHQFTIDGYALYEVSLDRVRLVRVAVHPAEHRRGVGRRLVAKVLELLRPHRDRLTCVVPEHAVGMQCLLRACGLRCWRSGGGVLRFVGRRAE